MFEDYVFALFERNYNRSAPTKIQKEESKLEESKVPKQEDSKQDESVHIAEEP